MKKYGQEKHKLKGYSFIEGIFATLIVTIGMIAVIQLVSSSLLVLYNSRNQTMATFLAQEGAEIVRNVRDNNWAANRSTFDSSDFPTVSKSGNNNSCRVDYGSTDVLNCSSGSNKILQINSNGIYLYDGGSPDSQFRRQIMIEYDTGHNDTANNATVTSEVTWGGKDFPDSLGDCDTLHNCAFTKVVLNKWGGVD